MSFRFSRLWPALIALAIILALSGCGRERGKTTAAKKETTVTTKETTKEKTARNDAAEGSAKEPAKDSAETAAVPGAAEPLPLAGGGSSLIDSFLGAAKGGAAQAKPAPDAGKTVKAAAPAPAPKIAPGKRPTSAQLLQLVQARYRNMKSLKLAKVASNSLSQDGKVVASQKDVKSSFVFKRPNKFVVKSGDGATYSDGKTIYEYNSQAKRYIKGEMSDDVLGRMVMGKPGISVVGLLLGMDYTPHIKSSKLLADSKVGGKDTYVLSLDLKAPDGASASDKLWIGKKDYGIYKEEFNLKMTPKAPADYKGKMPKSMQNNSSAVFTEFAPDVNVADSSFAFKPPAGAKEYEPPKEMKQPEPLSLLDKHAPDFSFKWTDGSTKKLSDFRGKTVVLDFWALPLAENHLPVLHSANKGAADGVQFITVCLNDDKTKIDEYMQGKGFSFPFVMANEDMAKTIMGDYRLVGVPAIYVIDKQGIVRRQLHGNITESDLNAKITKVAAM